MQAADLRFLARRIESWFARHQRPLPWREAYDPYHVWVSEVMLQQTRMEVVLPYFARFLERFPSVAALASATDHDVMAAWSGLGYYRRARMLRAGAAVVMERFGGVIPSTVDELLEIPGIGRYTAGAIASVAFEARAPIVDGNVTRVLARIHGSDGDAWPRAEALVLACSSPRKLNQGLMELGALVCTPRNPSCLVCPVRERCVAVATGRVDELPAPKPKKETRALRIDLFVVSDARGRVLMRRESGPLMNAMYHLPHGDTALLTGKPLAAVPRRLLGTFKHTVTTRKIEFTVYSADVERVRGSEYEWIDPETMHEVPHPSYVTKALRLLV
ncbi:MAG TPA: A/G-specific adenine glycosylase, partial [Thermoanaerobaculia bacterium]|nr:A/G-specific adenine glycosylase [Thermoanaerobaculia bacterium]